VDPADSIGVLIADDDARFRSIVVGLLDSEPDIEVVGQASGGREAVARAEELLPDVALLDVRMPWMDGIEATEAIHAALPTTRIVMLTTSDEEDDVYGALRAGACGYLLKEAGLDGLAGVIRTVVAGLGMVLSPSIGTRLLDEFRAPAPRSPGPTLSKRELEILALVSRGYANNEIARELSLSHHTVKRHVANILAKLHQRSRLDAVMVAMKNGVLNA
jgi:DNA-binding NarL/FixJ family response regulator